MSNRFLYKVIVLGDSGVGKTSLIDKFVTSVFKNQYEATVGIDLKFAHLEVADRSVKLQIWDTAGQERYASITNSYYQATDGVIVVADVSCDASLKSVHKWIDRARTFIQKDVPFVVVVNKTDLLHTSPMRNGYGFSQVNEILKLRGDDFIPVSVKQNINVSGPFHTLVQKILFHAKKVPSLKLKPSRRLPHRQCCNII